MVKKGKKKAAKVKEVDPLQLQLEELKKSIEDKTKEIELETQQSNLFQLEKNRLISNREIFAYRKEELKNDIRNIETEIEEQLEKHQVEIKCFKTKLRQLFFEHKVNIDRLKIESENALKIQGEECRSKQSQLKEDKRDLTEEMKHIEDSFLEAKKEIERELDQKNTELRKEFETRVEEINAKYSRTIQALREKTEKEIRDDVEKIERAKDKHIEQLLDKHKQDFERIKNYFSVITQNNIYLIKTLKDEVKTLKINEATNEKLMFEIAQENKKLSDPLMEALADVHSLRTELANYEKDKLTLKNIKFRLEESEKSLKKLQWNYEVTKQDYEKVSDEKNSLLKKFETSINQIQQKTMLKSQFLETKLKSLEDEMRLKDEQIEDARQRIKGEK